MTKDAAQANGRYDCLIIGGGPAGLTAATSLARFRRRVVVVAGKGHETTQDAGGTVLPFDDRVVVAEEWDRLGGGG